VPQLLLVVELPGRADLVVLLCLSIPEFVWFPKILSSDRTRSAGRCFQTLSDSGNPV